MTERDKKIRDLVIKVRGYYDGIDERLTDALKGILRRLDKPDHIPDAGKKVEIDTIKIRALLESIDDNKEIVAYVSACDGDISRLVAVWLIVREALALLPEAKCKKCGKLFFDADDYDTLGSESRIICSDCGSEEFEPAEKQDEDCAMWSMVGTKVYKKCAQVYKLEAQLETAKERIKKLEAHICGEPTAKLQFPKETK